MKTHNRILYHCLCCGRVVHEEPDAQSPNCCGQPMTNAAAETVYDAGQETLEDLADETVAEAPRPLIQPVPR